MTISLDLINASWNQVANAPNCTDIKNCRVDRGIANMGIHTRSLLYAVHPEEMLTEENFIFMKDVANDALAPFTMFIFLEYLLVRTLHGRWMQLAEALPNLYCGTLMQVVRLAFHAAEFFLYDEIYHWWHWGYADTIDWTTWTSWISVLMGIDLCYYIFHRCAHEIAIMWTMHQVHHSSEFFNLSVPFRLSHLQDFAHSGLFFAPLALLGVPLKVTFVHKQLNLIYQFWTHSELIPKLPWPIEFIFNTPSHHRVHHARQAKYLDKNYGAVLIVWDRMFGTFCEEDDADAPVYGVTVPQRTLNVLTYQLTGLVELYGKFKTMRGWKNKLQCLFKGPGWEPGSPWTGFIEKVPVPDRNDKPVLKEMSPFWQTFLFVDLSMIYIIFVLFLSRFDQVPHSSFYVLTIVLYYHAYCTAKTLEGDDAAAGLQALKLAGMSFLVPFARSIFSNVSPLETLLLKSAELIGFGLSLATGLYIVTQFNGKRKLD